MAFRHNSTVADSEPTWSEVDKTIPRIAFAYMGESDKPSTWGYPHHWVQGGGSPDENGRYTTGTLYLHRGGLNAAWSAAQGGRSGQKAAPEVRSHLQSHRTDLGLDDNAEDSLIQSPHSQLWGADSVGLHSEMTDGALDLYVYDEISQWGIEAVDIARILGEHKDVSQINLYLNSPGGLAWDAVAAYNMLRRHKAHVTAHVDGVAASAATILLMAGDERKAAEGAMLMVHNAWAICLGSAADMREMGTFLDLVDKTITDIYVTRTGHDRQKLVDLVNAQTWMDADMAREFGFIDGVEAKPAEQAYDLSVYPNAPRNLCGTGRKPRFSQFYQASARLSVWPTLQIPNVMSGSGPDKSESFPKTLENTMSQENQSEQDKAAANAKAEAEAKAKADAEAKAAAEKAAQDKAAAEKAAAEAKAAADKAGVDSVEKTKTETTEANKRILAMCKLAQKPDMATDLLGKTEDEARKVLFEAVCQDRKPVGDGEGSDLGTKKPDPNDAFRKEFRDGGGQAKLGVTEEQFVKSRRVDEGLDTLGE